MFLLCCSVMLVIATATARPKKQILVAPWPWREMYLPSQDRHISRLWIGMRLIDPRISHNGLGVVEGFLVRLIKMLHLNESWFFIFCPDSNTISRSISASCIRESICSLILFHPVLLLLRELGCSDEPQMLKESALSLIYYAGNQPFAFLQHVRCLEHQISNWFIA
jgi:hypothetical protein